MTATYDSSLTTDKDKVRFYVGDRAAPFSVSDEEINAILTDPEYPNVFLAAAAVGDVIASRGKGAVSKSVAELSLTRATSAGSAYGDALQRLRARGAKFELKRSGSHVFRSLGPKDC